MRTLHRRHEGAPISSPSASAPAPVPTGVVSAWSIPAGVFAWFALGVVARGWMRLIADDPGFSWSGTTIIVGAFAVAGFGHSIARVVRSRARRRWSNVARALGAVLTLPLFGGAGAAMLPTVAGGSLATWRRDWPGWLRVLVALGAVPIPVVVVVDVLAEGHGWARATGLVLFVATYAVVVRSMRSVVAPLGDGWRLPRWVRRALIVVGAIQLVSLAVGGLALLVR